METKEITLDNIPIGKEIKQLGDISCQWDKKYFDLGHYVEFKFVVDKEGEEVDVTSSILVIRTSPREGKTSPDSNEIVFKNVELEFQPKMHISKWKEHEGQMPL